MARLPVKTMSGGPAQDGKTVLLQIGTADDQSFEFVTRTGDLGRTVGLLIGLGQAAAAQMSPQHFEAELPAEKISPPPIPVTAIKLEPGRSADEAHLTVNLGAMRLTFAVATTALTDLQQVVAALAVSTSERPQ